MADTAVTGRLTRAPEVKELGGKDLVSFTLADNWKKKDQSFTNWFVCETWDKRLGQIILDYATKGREVYVAGVQYHDEWEDKNGNKRITVKIKINTFKLLGTKAQAQEDENEDEEQIEVPF